MHSLGLVLTLFGTLLFLAALVTVIYPIKALRIPTRKRALMVLMASFVVFMVAGYMFDEQAVPSTNETAAVPARQTVPSTNETAAVPARQTVPSTNEAAAVPARQTVPSTNEAAAVPAQADVEVIGQWEDKVGTSWTQHIRIVRKGTTIIRESRFHDGSVNHATLTEVAPGPNQRRRFKNLKSNFGQAYAIDSRGNLDLFDNEGFIREARRM